MQRVGGTLGNKWFKHWNTAHESDGFKNAIYAREYPSIVLYWFAVELISKHEDREIAPGYCTLHERYLAKLLGMNVRGLASTIEKFDQYFGQSLVITWSKHIPKLARNLTVTLPKVSDDFVQFFAPNWIELQETRGGKRQANAEQKAGRSKKREERRKKKEKAPADFTPIKEFSDHPRLVEILRVREVTTATQQAWIDAYPNPSWVKQEIFKAIGWEESKRERKTNFGQFVSNWLSRGWGNAPAVQAQPSRGIKTFDEVRAELGLANG